ncbi:MAG TPA: hypothetical protein VMC09_07955, partial [Anaerolineales bacterium]|nr:hypothetical protein [Anaerolineales bacterium]
MPSPFRSHTVHTLLVRAGISACLLGVLTSACGPQVFPTPTATVTLTPTPPPPTSTSTASLTPTIAPTQTPYVITATSAATAAATTTPQGVFFLSLADGGHYHLFAYSPQTLPLTRITNGGWDDLSPALSPDGHFLAYSSRKNGFWNIYLLELASGGTIQLTDTPEYDGAPSWSPDGAYITYESYVNGNMDVYIQSVTDRSQAPIRLTADPAADMTPVWSPRGRQIAFVSTRSSGAQIWLVDLDHPDESLDVNISNSNLSGISHPAWSPDGSQLAWSGTDAATGLTGIYVWDARNPNTPARLAGAGDWPVWQDNSHMATRLTAPNQTFLTGFSSNGTISLPPVLLQGPLDGLAFGYSSVALPGAFQSVAQVTPAPLFNPVTNPQSVGISGRLALLPLSGVQVPYPQLVEPAYDSYAAFRGQVARDIGWDALASLENAYIPLTTPLDPGLGDDWLYTGRAITLNQALIQAGWMVIVREDFGEQTYWRVYLRTTAQDGSEGMPLTQIPWDFSTRTGSPSAYENGGSLMKSYLAGYWYDLTALAIQYGWRRLPA